VKRGEEDAKRDLATLGESEIASLIDYIREKEKDFEGGGEEGADFGRV